MSKTMIAAFVTTALAGAALFWAADHGTSTSEPKAAPAEVAMQSDDDAASRADALRERMAETRARIDELANAPRGTQPRQPRQPKQPKQPRQPDPDAPTPHITIDPACLANPICSKNH